MKNDPLDWNGDHLHTNFRGLYQNLRYLLVDSIIRSIRLSAAAIQDKWLIFFVCEYSLYQ